MHINFKDREIELKFGLRTLTEIDKELGFEVEGARLGQGLEMLVPKLESGNIIGLSKIIKAATAHDKKSPKTYEDLELVLDNIAENVGYEEFGQQVLEELGKRPMTRGLLPEELRPEKKEKTKEA
ncbi:tail assembly chaperone [Virgibacillus pantothenticus]|uniref:tail assembly chaperone n=1 Tax=Virgibacillus pantothenticus TaxID=1473 RepID=UPI000985E526|nr:tail assembly chaperone [Virgibacillus pantothenticus]MBU8567588.1 tail assembly chaperone [Virgibacillus pantothenticus]MBU8601376.1 tail assembly chaperone [Virgibacillus pantothenticus]MBU8636193.1 tail assembly chaperone [Virgibacillus pantothenticus]MBU8643713.1 tail assembly chaperone [Virgibacillus pantothenticus]MBU8648031.1 tail assembly chaperone [Virgibacillus pantothenticus]